MLLMMLHVAAGVAFKRKHSATCKDPGIATITCASGNVYAIFFVIILQIARLKEAHATQLVRISLLVGQWALNIGPFFALGLARGVHAL